MKKKILITGGKGFIGTHLVERLKDYYNVIVYDIVDGNDILDLDNLIKKSKGCKTIVHLAALISDNHKPEDIFKINCMGTLNVLEACRINKIDKLIFASSASIYGDKSKSPYGTSKVIGESLVKSYCDSNKFMNGIILRFFNVYGMNSSSVVDKLINCVLCKEKFIIYRDRYSIRDYIHVLDIVDIISFFIRDKYMNGTYDIGTGIGTSVNDLIEMIPDNKSFPLEINFDIDGGIPYSVANIKKLKELDIYPMRSLKKYIEKNI